VCVCVCVFVCVYNETLRRVHVTTVALLASYKIFRTAVKNKRFLGVHVKRPIFLPDFNKSSDLRDRFS